MAECIIMQLPTSDDEKDAKTNKAMIFDNADEAYTLHTIIYLSCPFIPLYLRHPSVSVCYDSFITPKHNLLDKQKKIHFHVFKHQIDGYKDY